MIKKMLLAVTALALSAPALAFVPDGTLTNSSDGDGFIQFTSPGRFVLAGANNEVFDNFTNYSTVATVGQIISGQFRYQTFDNTPGNFDPAGYFINNDFFQLSEGFLPQYGVNSGTFSFAVEADDIYGFYVLSTDGFGGRGVLTVGSIPEPQSWAMMIAGFGLVGASLRRRRAAAIA